MAETREVIRIRIEALQHNREFIATLVGGLTLVYTAIGAIAVNQGLLSIIGSSTSVNSPAYYLEWKILALTIFVTVAITDMKFILAIYLLTDSIHNYSKIVEYGQKDLFTDSGKDAVLAHQRALAADDLSYFYLRVGVFFLVWNLLLLIAAITTIFIVPLSLWAIILMIFACAFISFSVVIHAYRVSHYRTPAHSLFQSVVRFWNPFRWKKAVGEKPLDSQEKL